MATRPLLLRIGYDRMEDEHRRSDRARLARDPQETAGVEREERSESPRPSPARAARAALTRRPGHRAAHPG